MTSGCTGRVVSDFTLPTAGTYTIGLFRISLVEPVECNNELGKQRRDGVQ